MATKKNGLDDLDLDNFDIFSMEGDPSATKPPEKGDRREAITKISTSFAKGAAEVLTDSDQIRRFAVGSLPDGYGTTINTGFEVAKSVRGLYNEAVEELRPAMPFLRRVAGKISASNHSLLPARLQKTIKEFSEQTDPNGFIESQATRDNQNMNSELGNLFGTQLQMTAAAQEENSVRTMIRDQVSARQNQTLAQLMEGVRANTARQVAFQDQITNRYMRKSLELQYRQFFATRDLLNIALRRERTDTEMLKNIMRNTGLPDYVKLPLHEAASASFRDRLLGAGQKTAARYVSEFSNSLVKNLRGSMKNALSGLVSGAQMGESMMDSADMEAQMEREMEELGIAPDSRGQKMGRTAGKMVTDFALPFAASPIRKLLSRSSKLRKGGAKAGMFTDVIAERMNEWAQSDTNSSSWFAPLIWMLKDAVPKFNLDRSLGDAAIVGADKPVPFDGLTRRSIVEVIPGYLSRILREITVLRTGDESAETVTYNLDRGEFTTKRQAAKDAARRLFSPADSRQLRDQVSTVMSMLGGDQMTEQQRKELGRQMTRDAASGRAFNFERYTDGESATQDLSYDSKAGLKGIFDKAMAGDGKMLKEEKQLEVMRAFRQLQNYYKNPRGAMSVYRDAGQREILEMLGVVDRMGFSDRVNYDTVNDIILGNTRNEFTPDGTVEGGGNVKRHSWTPGGFDPKTASDKFGDKVVSGVDKVRDSTARLIAQLNSQSIRGLKGKALEAAMAARKAAQSMLSTDLVNYYNKLSVDAKSRVAKIVSRYSEMAVKPEDLEGGASVDIFEALPPEARAQVESIVLNESVAEAGSSQAKSGPSSSLFRSVRDSAPPSTSYGSSASQAPGAAGISDETMDRLLSLNEEQAEIQKAILDALINLNFSGGGGEGGEQPKKSGFFSRTFSRLWGGARKAGSAYAKYAGFVLRSPFMAAGAAGRMGMDLAKGIFGKAVADIYVVGETTPALKKKKLIKGDYRDIKTKKPVRYIKDIKNPVIDVTVKDGSPVIDEEMIEKGFYTLKDGKPSVIRRIGGTLGSVVSTVAGAYGQIFKLPFMLTGGAAKLANNMIKKLFDGRKDVYVRGQPGPNPVLRAIHMDGRHYFTDSGKGVTHIKQLDGKTVIFARDRETILIGAEEYDKGLVDVHGRPLKTYASRLADAALGLATGVVSMGARIVGGAARGFGKFIGGGYSMMGGIGGGIMRKIGGMFGMGKKGDGTDGQATQVLIAIHDMLDARLPGKKFRKGSWQERFANREKEKEKTEDKKEKKEGVDLLAKLGSLFSKGAKSLASIFGFGDDEEDGGGGGGNTTVIGGGDGEGKKGKDGQKMSKKERQAARAAEKAKASKLAARRKGKFGMLFRAKDAVGGRLGKLFNRGGRGAGAAAGAASTAGKAGWLSRARGFVGSPWKMAGTAAAMYGGSQALDYALGEDTAARSAVSTTADVAGGAMTASWLSGLLGGPTISSLLGIGGGAAAGAGGAGAAGAVGTAATGVAGAGAAVTIGVPVAVGTAVGYAGYKGYKNYKYGGFTALRGYRMAQYGVNYNDAGDVETVMDLESMLEQTVKSMGGGLDLESGRIKMEDVYEMFGIDDGWFTDNSNERKMFDAWFNARFKPVYLRWIAELRTIKPGTPLNEADDKLKPDEMQKLIRAARGVDSGVYSLRAGPFGDLTDITGERVQEVYIRAEREIKDMIEGKGGLNRGLRKINNAMMGTGIFGSTIGRVSDWADETRTRIFNDNSPEGIAKLIGDVGGDGTGGAFAGYGAITVSAAASVGMSGSGTLSALQGLRMRAYGLIEMDKDRVQLLLKMERDMLAKTIASPTNPAQIQISLEEAWKTYGLSFGLDGTDQAMRERWMTWFQYRFLAVVTAFATKAAELLKSTDMSNLDGRLKVSQKYDVGVAISQAKTGGGYDMPIWKVYFSPWDPKERLNENVSSVHGVLLTLKEGLKSEPVGEERAQGQDAKVQYDKAKLDAITAGAPAAQSRSWWDKTKGFFTGDSTQKSIFGRAADGVTATMDNLSEARSQIGQGNYAQAGRALVGAVTAPGRYISGQGAGPEVKLDIKGNAKEREAMIIREAIANGITNPTELAMMLGQMAAETGRFNNLVENLKYRPEVAKRVWPSRFRDAAHAAQILSQGTEAFAEHVYGNRRDLGNNQPGDGFKFRGRGLMQLTGRSNYTAFARWSGIDVVNNPDQVATDPRVAAKSAIYWWLNRGRGLRQLAQQGDLGQVTRLVNGGQTGLEHRRSYFNQYLAKFQGKTIEQIAAEAGTSAATAPTAGAKADFSGVTARVTSSSGNPAAGNVPTESGIPLGTAVAPQIKLPGGLPSDQSGSPSAAAPRQSGGLTAAIAATAPVSSSGAPTMTSPTAVPGLGQKAQVSQQAMEQYRQTEAQGQMSRQSVSAANEATLRTTEILSESLDVQRKMLDELIRISTAAVKGESRAVKAQREEDRSRLQPPQPPRADQGRGASGASTAGISAQPGEMRTNLPINVSRQLTM